MNTFEYNELLNYLTIIKKRKNTIFIFLLLVVCFTLLFNIILKPKYQSAATILIDTDNANILPVKEILSIGTSDYWAYKEYLKTQVEIIQGRTIAKEVFSNYYNRNQNIFKTSYLNNDDKLSKMVEKGKNFLNDESKNKSSNQIIEFEKALSEFRKRLKIVPIKESRLINIIFENENSNVAADVANDIAQEFVKSNLLRKQKIAKDARVWLHDEIEKLKLKLQESEIKLQEFRSKNNLISADERIDIINQTINDLTKKMNDAESTFAEYVKRYRLKHPKMKQIMALVTDLYDKVNDKRKEAIKFEEKMIEYNSLIREVNLTKNLLENVINREKETLITGSVTSNNVSIVEEAVPAIKPFKPKKFLNLFLALIFGFLGGVLLSLILETLESKISTSEDFEKHGIKFLGVIPQIKIPLLQNKTYRDSYLLHHNKGIISELFNNIRTSILLSNDGKILKTKSILITSFIPGEGKTMFSSNLSLSLAKYNFKIILVEADLRKPRIAKSFKLKSNIGLSNYLQGLNSIEDIIQHSKHSNLDIITAGSIIENPSELLGNGKLIELKTILENMYEIVIFDAPPVFAVTDPIILANIIKHIILIARYNFSPKNLIPKLKDKVLSAKCDIIGAVINDVVKSDDKLNSEYGYNDYYGK